MNRLPTCYLIVQNNKYERLVKILRREGFIGTKGIEKEPINIIEGRSFV